MCGFSIFCEWVCQRRPAMISCEKAVYTSNVRVPNVCANERTGSRKLGKWENREKISWCRFFIINSGSARSMCSCFRWKEWKYFLVSKETFSSSFDNRSPSTHAFIHIGHQFLKIPILTDQIIKKKFEMEANTLLNVIFSKKLLGHQARWNNQKKKQKQSELDKE